MLRKSLFASLFITLLLAVAAVPGFAISKEFNQTYPLQSGGTFELQNVNGPVEVQGWDRDEVEVRAVKTAKHRETDLERVSIEVNADSRSVSVATHYPQNEGVEVAVQYTIHVPHSAHIEHLGTVNGTLRIAGVPQVEDVHTVNGNIEVYDSAGNVHAHTTNGNVRVEVASMPEASGTLAETTNGSVLLAVPTNAQANIETRCLNGNFSSDLPIAMETTLHPREMIGKLGHGGGSIKLRTVNGGIRVVALQSTI